MTEGIKCFYCGKNMEDDNDFYEKTMYQVFNKDIPLGYKLNTRDIKIPRCHSCFIKHSKFELWVIIPMFAICFILGFIIIPRGGLKLLPSIITVSVVSAFIAHFISKLINALLFTTMMGIPRENDVMDYPPIKILLDLNWHMNKPDPLAVGENDIAKDSPYYKGDK